MANSDLEFIQARASISSRLWFEFPLYTDDGDVDGGSILAEDGSAQYGLTGLAGDRILLVGVENRLETYRHDGPHDYMLYFEEGDNWSRSRILSAFQMLRKTLRPIGLGNPDPKDAVPDFAPADAEPTGATSDEDPLKFVDKVGLRD